jgi:hypothetical protein
MDLKLPTRRHIGVDLSKRFGYYHPLNGTELGNGGRRMTGRGTPDNRRRRTLIRGRAGTGTLCAVAGERNRTEEGME